MHYTLSTTVCICTPCQGASFPSKTDSFLRGHGPDTLACKARPSFDAAAVPSCTDLDPKRNQLSSQARRTAPTHSLYFSVACQKSSSNFWRSLLFVQIVRSSSARRDYAPYHSIRDVLSFLDQPSERCCVHLLLFLQERPTQASSFCKSSNFL